LNLSGKAGERIWWPWGEISPVIRRTGHKKITNLSKTKRRIIEARTIEVAILVAMSNHLYTFGGKVYLQTSGGPIGLRFTACLASALMKVWDMAWCELLNKEKIRTLIYKRYVDDSRNLLLPISEGWRWQDDKFKFNKATYAEDMKTSSYEQDQIRTRQELTKAMNSLVYFLRFTGEDWTMFANGRLPTLDTEVWVENNEVRFAFFEKPTVPNRTLQATTALSKSALYASLTQEVIRRMNNCCHATEPAARADIISKFAQKVVNSGHTNSACRKIIINGLVKYQLNLEKSRLPSNDPQYKPIYLRKEFKEHERQIAKMAQKENYYKANSNDQSWRSKVDSKWRIENFTQRKLKGMEYTTIMEVPNTPESKLFKLFTCAEPGLSRLTKYQVKFVEQSGTKLASLFQRKITPKRCKGLPAKYAISTPSTASKGTLVV